LVSGSVPAIQAVPTCPRAGGGAGGQGPSCARHVRPGSENRRRSTTGSHPYLRPYAGSPGTHSREPRPEEFHTADTLERPFGVHDVASLGVSPRCGHAPWSNVSDGRTLRFPLVAASFVLPADMGSRLNYMSTTKSLRTHQGLRDPTPEFADSVRAVTVPKAKRVGCRLSCSARRVR
jgi:hypothetical protein